MDTSHLKLGVFGSATDTSVATRTLARQLGTALGRYRITVITGACSGLPYEAARAAHQEGCRVLGFSPTLSPEEQALFTPDDDLSIYSDIVYVPRNVESASLDVRKKLRNVVSTSNCDGALVIGGAWGTLHECCSLLDYGTPIGLLETTGGVADALTGIASTIAPTAVQLLEHGSDPSSIVDTIVHRVR